MPDSMPYREGTGFPCSWPRLALIERLSPSVLYSSNLPVTGCVNLAEGPGGNLVSYGGELKHPHLYFSLPSDNRLRANR